MAALLNQQLRYWQCGSEKEERKKRKRTPGTGAVKGHSNSFLITSTLF